MKSIVRLSFVILCFQFLFACSEKADKKEAIKNMKAADGYLINLASQFASSAGYEAFTMLRHIPGLPLPFQASTYNNSGETETYLLKDHAGLYNYDASRGELTRIDDHQYVSVSFPFKNKKDASARMVLKEYHEESTVWGVNFPTVLEAYIEIDDRPVMIFKMEGGVEHGVPVFGVLTIEAGQFIIQMSMKTRFFRSTGKAAIEAAVLRRGEEALMLEGKFRIRINPEGSYTVKRFNGSVSTFPIICKADVEYGKIDPAVISFVPAFNEHASIRVSSRKGLDIGSIELMDVPDNNRLNVGIVFHDGSIMRIDESLLVLENILNIKL